MGQQYCCRGKTTIRLPDLQKDLKIRNQAVLLEAARLRDENSKFIADSSIYCSKEGVIFKGQMDNSNKKIGYGQFYQKQHAYLGRFQSDLPEGYGLAIKDTDEYYRGNFQNGLFHGSGKEYGPNYEFEGDFQTGSRKKGIFKNDHFQYQGQFHQNTFNGEGRIIFTNGTSYEGQFSNGKFQGLGILALENGKYYRGQFKQGKFHGGSKMKWLQGAKKQQKYIKPLSHKQSQLAQNKASLSNEQDINQPTGKEKELKNSRIQYQAEASTPNNMELH